MICDARHIPSNLAGYDPRTHAGECHFDQEAADRAVEFFRRCLKFVKGRRAREPFVLEPWQADIVRTLFGWKRPDGTRRYRQAFIEVPRKNGKSTLIAGIALYVLFCDGEEGAECYCAASDANQAGLVFASAKQMVEGSSLGSRSRVLNTFGNQRIIYGNSFLRVIPASERGSHGYDSHLIIGDELHAWDGREFHDVMHTSTGARSQPLELYITTAGYDRNSVCYEKYLYATNVRDNQIEDETFLPVIYEATEDDDWTDPAVWAKANPNLGVSVSLEYIERECEKAKTNPSYENTFRRLHLNQWTQQESRWLQMDKWRKCRITSWPLDPSQPVYGGLDLSSTKDVTACVLCQPIDGGWRVRGHYFIPEATLREAEQRDRVPYAAWARAGYVTPTPGQTVDYSVVHQWILEQSEKYEIGSIGYDPWNCEPTRIYLEDKGLSLHSMRQGVATLHGPSKELERAVIEGVLDHGGDPVLAWMAENVQVKTDENGNIRPVKPDHGASGKRIDGIVATIMAIGTAQLVAPEPEAGFCFL